MFILCRTKCRLEKNDPASVIGINPYLQGHHPFQAEEYELSTDNISRIKVTTDSVAIT